MSAQFPCAVARGRRRADERGSALFVSLIFLVLITLLAISASWQGTLQERLSAGQRRTSVALAGADAALRYGESWVFTAYQRSNGEALVGSSDGASGVFTAHELTGNQDIAEFRVGGFWSEKTGTSVPDELAVGEGSDATFRLTEAPRFVVEDLGALRPPGSSASTVAEGGSTGSLGYVSGGMQPAANSELRIYRITGKSRSITPSPVKTTQSHFAGRATN